MEVSQETLFFMIGELMVANRMLSARIAELEAQVGSEKNSEAAMADPQNE